MPTAQSGFFEWVFFFLKTYGNMFLQGAGITLMIALTGTISGFLIGLGSGVNVQVAQHFGARRMRDLGEIVHTSALLCLLMGIALAGAAAEGAKSVYL